MLPTSGFDIISVGTSLLTGYYLGKWDSRGSDVKVFDELAYQISTFLVSVKAGYVGGVAEKAEIDKFRQVNFGSFPEPPQEGSKIKSNQIHSLSRCRHIPLCPTARIELRLLSQSDELFTMLESHDSTCSA